jgi:cell division protein FtsA
MKSKNLISAIDIGSTKICVLTADIDEETQSPHILGYGIVPAQGIKKGVITNVDAASSAIADAIAAAESTSEQSIASCYVSISGEHIRSMNTKGVVTIASETRSGAGEAREIEEEDKQRVLERARTVALPVDRQVLHVIPQEFCVDEQSGIKEPIHLTGRHLEAKVHLTTYSTTAAANLSRCLKNAKVEIEALVLQSLAASYATLKPDELELGTILIDIGSGTSDVIVYYDEGVHHTGVVTLAGQAVTSDIAYLLRVPLKKAELIKKEYGCAKVSLIENERLFQIDELGAQPPRKMSTKLLTEYIEPRMEEILRETNLEARKADISLRNTLAVVLTGGCANLKGVDKLAETIFDAPARIGIPFGYSSYEEIFDDPAYATAIGMLKFAVRERKSTSILQKIPMKRVSRFWRWIKKMNDNF